MQAGRSEVVQQAVPAGCELNLGVAVQWPSWYSLGWVVLYGIVCHWMILTEEEYLQDQYGEAYDAYCEMTPRYFWFW